MKVDVNKLCQSCCKIRPVMNDGKPSEISVGEFLSGPGYQNTAAQPMMNLMVKSYLEGNSGCSSCISLLKRVTGQ